MNKAAEYQGGLRLLFAGCPAIVLPSLRMIAEGAKAGHWSLIGILTNPDKPRGRGGILEPTEAGIQAVLLTEEFTALGLPPPAILKYETLKTEAREAVYALHPALLVSFAYGRIFGPKFLSLFPMGGINTHPSLLPKYRGASPIQEAILHRDTETGISIQRIAAEMDTGNILAQEKIPLSGRETTASLSEIAAVRGAELLQKVLEQFREAVQKTRADTVQGAQGEAALHRLEGIPQQGKPSYCALIEKNFGLIDWNKSALEIDAQIRACIPWPVARTVHKEQTLNILEAAPYSGPEPYNRNSLNTHTVSPARPGQLLGIDKKNGILIQTGDGILSVSRLQYQTKKALHWQAFLNGARDLIGSRLTGGS